MLRSPFIDKKSREQFEIRTHKRLIYISEPTSQTVDASEQPQHARGRGHPHQGLKGLRARRRVSPERARR